MSLRQLTIIGTGLIGGSFGLALKKRGFAGTIVGCDRGAILEHAQSIGAIDVARVNPVEAILGSQVVLLATPVGSIIEMIRNLGPAITDDVLLTDVGSTKLEIVAQARHIFGADYDHRFLPGHPIAGKEHSGIEFADPDLFQGALWYFTPDINREPTTLAREFAGLVGCVGAHIAAIDPAEHDRLCAWTSHLPQMLSTALAASLVEEFGPDARLLENGGRALTEMTRIAGSPYSMWRDIALTNQENLSDALLKVEQRLAHIRENLKTRELESEFDQAHKLRNT
ncbi:MAG: prephenate dehydrogenase/arogenate dehydrogenase family protein [Acidobacteria bacterium]|nr:MAG: prephenate dehydrogenase/arogenate dehydrogenase family protein [Acidobacteriota bacterium]